MKHTANNRTDSSQPQLLPERKDAIVLVSVIAGTALLFVVFFRQINEFAARWILPCLLLTLTGLRCPLCGGTRCVRALAELDIAGAFYYNPMVVLTGVVCLYIFVRLVISCFGKDYKPYAPRVGEKGMYIILAAYLLFFIIRNLPFYQMYFY